MPSRRVPLWLVIAALASAPAAAQAQTAADLETARALFKEGKELRAKGDLQGALEKLLAAHAVGRTPITGLELARTHGMLEQLVEAREVALDVARIRVASDETERSAEARADAALLAEELRGRIPDVTVRVSGLPRDAPVEVLVDGKALPPALVGQPVRVDPGEHVVVIAAPGGATSRSTVKVAERESAVVTLPYPVPPTGAAAPSTRPEAAVPPLPEPEPSGFFFGVSFAAVVQAYLPQQPYASGRDTMSELTVGADVEAGAALTPDFEIALRGLATVGPRGNPVSDLVGIGPAASFRLARRWWLGATLLAGRGEANFSGVSYSTDWVFAPALDVSFAAIDGPRGQWLLSASVGYLLADTQRFAPLVFAPILFGYRSF